jgi:hypothetical protein
MDAAALGRCARATAWSRRGAAFNCVVVAGAVGCNRGSHQRSCSDIAAVSIVTLPLLGGIERLGGPP